MEAIIHANKNTKQTLEHIRDTINKHKSPLPHSITTPKNILRESKRGSVGR
ncbi:hypothetical protein RMONA_01415 [Rickettsia monacensis]|uniref:Uncharacterized protein n=1 Tax=Rickettsia monacensis TaxID=109232 RepID=A0A0B7IY42_9RICK|nr:hypothetical protein RMONA_1230 [Rickettsia monacensis IrR/Munich]CEO16701.1 hypothetical protein RMONA_01415 [Rickettsia monacensis]